MATQLDHGAHIHSMRPSAKLISGLIDMVEVIPPDLRGSMVEIGCYQGESTMVFSAMFKSVDAIDPWGTVDPLRYKIPQIDEAEAMFDHRLRFMKNVTKVIGTSPEASLRYPDKSLDFAYIDGHHGFSHVVADIRAWMPKIREGGFLGGHDYDALVTGCVEVKPAVDSIFDKAGQVQVFCDSSWIVRL